ncbi:MAG: lysine--tRNA ligase [Clostridiales bacterium 38-18]|nr:MAG: lysine--tRNA ligase [Clostridiales bacterium 38-18]
MHWAIETAAELIRQHGTEETIVCASGISPSGHVHIGNFREVVTTYFVVRALESLGAKTRFIFSWDDYDRFRKVPAGIPEHFEAYIGLPYSEVPDPYGCHSSYAAHFEAEFESALARFNIYPEFIYQSEMYQAGTYTEAIREALLNRHQIYDIITSYKTQDWDEVERASYYPINIYCRSCGKDTMTDMHYDSDSDILEYTCACGHHEYTELEGFNRIKLTWKVDWPMRWRHENVVFEPGGRDHSAENGSFRVSSDLTRKIFSRPAPHYIPYEFIGLKGNSAKMSSSTGHLITPADLLKVYPAEIILFLFSKYDHRDAFDIGLDEDINRLYTEYERLVGRYFSDESLDAPIAEMLQLSVPNASIATSPKFSNIASTLPLLNFDRSLLMSLMTEYDFSNEEVLNAFNMKCEHVEFWLRNLSSKRLPTVQDIFNSFYYKSLTQTEKNWIDTFKNLIASTEINHMSSEVLLQTIYDIVQHSSPSQRRKDQKRFFEIIYRMILGQSNGPQITLLIQMVPQAKMIKLLSA